MNFFYITIVRTVLLALLACNVNYIYARLQTDTTIMTRIFAFRRNYASLPDGEQTSFYMKYTMKTQRRNLTLFLIPTMYPIAKGDRSYISESFGKISFNSIKDFQIKRQVVCGTIPRNRQVMSIMNRSLVPDIYGVTIFEDKLLSPFNYNNRRFYRYRISAVGENTVIVNFRPKTQNTQLIRGFAIVDNTTGRIIRYRFRGSYDLLNFEFIAYMGYDDKDVSLVPKKCQSNISFNFMGNKITSKVLTYFNCGRSLPDSIDNLADSRLMDTIRVDTLDLAEKEIYKKASEQKRRTVAGRNKNSGKECSDTQMSDSITEDSIGRKKGMFRKNKDRVWDAINDNMLNSIGTEFSNASINLSPLLNPLYLSYSNSKGLAYKLKVRSRYSFSENQQISFDPRFGYNFKIKQFYFNAPFRYCFNMRKNGWIELKWANGNRIDDSGLLDNIRNENIDTISPGLSDRNHFTDESVTLMGNISLFHNVNISIGGVYHNREASNKKMLRDLGKTTSYRSFAPALTFTVQPITDGPVFMSSYERCINGFLGSNMEYEKIELDASYKKQVKRLQQYNMRIGGGFYTNRSTSYFVDFNNFRENFIPGGWDDDWSGEFQLLDSRWYNASKYYVRANASYESPLLFVSKIPAIGKYIETERLYISTLLIEHTRPYFEVGYGFTNRYFSVGVFASMLNLSYNEFGCKFSFEMFRKW